MSENVTYRWRDQVTVYAHKHTRMEHEAAWNEGQGNHEARAKGPWCVVVPCDKETALVLSALFHRRFAIESCCYWDGKELSMYCGDAGSGANQLRDDINKLVGNEPGTLFAKEEQ